MTPRPRSSTKATPLADGHLHETILENLADGVYFVDTERRITYWNHGAERLTGYTPGDMVGRQCFDNILNHVDAGGAGLCNDRCPLVAAIADGQAHEAEVWLRHADGSRRPVRVRTAPIRNEADIVVGAVEIFDDATLLVTAREQAEAARQDALIDALTGLPNRRFFDMMLGARIEDLERYGTPFALLIGDIDHFKHVNDTYGHAAGDDVLRAVAATLRGALRGGDFVARWGGEEFAVIAQQTGASEARGLAERLRALVAATAVHHPGGVTTATISIGGATPFVDQGRSIDQTGGEAARDLRRDMLARADAALYAAKAAGRNRVLVDG